MSERSTANLLALATGRRSLLKGAGAAGLAAAGAGLLGTMPVWADDMSGSAADSVKTIFSIARTAEQLAVTFYTNGIQHAADLGLSGAELDVLKAAVIEEQIHQFLFAAQGGDSLADTFSFPDGAKTFTDLATFVANQQLLEGSFDAAFIAAVQEFAQLGLPRVAQIACQIAMIESEHRTLVRDIANRHGIGALPNTTGVKDQGGLIPDGTVPTAPADNWAFAPALLASVGEAPAVLKGAGFLGPNATYHYMPVLDQNGADLLNLGLAGVSANIMFKTPFAAPAPSGQPSGGSSGSSSPTELKGSASGTLVGNSGGAFAMYVLSKPSGSGITLTLTYSPRNSVNGQGVALEAYQNGSRLGGAADANGSGTVTLALTPSGNGAVLIKVDNYINGLTISYTLTQS